LLFLFTSALRSMMARVSDDSHGLLVAVLVPTVSVAALLIVVQNEIQEVWT